MQILRRSKREITIMQWQEQLDKAKKRLADSMECQRRFGDSEEWIKEDKKKVEEIERCIQEVVVRMDELGIK